MRRDLQHLARSEFDLIVVGGGIYGAWAALDAAQRGLSVALVEQGDFCSATSANNHKIIHGGLRYLQHGDLRRMRESIRERSILLRNAPALVRPMPVMVPTARRWSQHRLVMGAALLVNDLVGSDRNDELAAGWQIPRGRLVGPAECADLCPQMDTAEMTGGAIFHDAQVLSTERLVLSILRSASAAGASLANHVRVTGYLRRDPKGGGTRGSRPVCGVRAVDRLTGDPLEIRGRLVLNCAGPWSAELARLLGSARQEAHYDVFKAAVLVVRDMGLKTAIAIPGRSRYRDSAEVLRKNYRNFFITPWRGLSLIGTFYAPHAGSADRCAASEAEIACWLNDINAAWPGFGLTRADIYRVMTGLLPRAAGSEEDPQYAKRAKIIDHGRQDGIEGVISLIGVKFTTARGVAERAIDLAVRRLGCAAAGCATHTTPLDSAPAPEPDICRAAAELEADPAALRRVITRAVRREMACTLGDAILRRTELAAAGVLSESCLATCAAVAARELGWDPMQTQREVEQVRAACGQGGFVNAA
jgi:glycerol-3-phosphate dehydrogenase